MTSVDVTCQCGEKINTALERKYGSEQFHPIVVTCRKCERRMLVRAECEVRGVIEAYLQEPEEAD